MEGFPKSFFNFSYIVKLGATTKKFLTPLLVYKYVIMAPINLVLPTPVASSKVNDWKGLSNSLNIGYIFLIFL